MESRGKLIALSCALAFSLHACDGGGDGDGGGDAVADLVVAVLTSPATASAGATVRVPAMIRNDGVGVASAFRVGVYLSTDATIDLASDTLIGSWNVPGLGVVVPVQSDVAATIPAGMTPGSYYIGAVADDLDALAETDESNNTTSGGAVSVGAAVTVNLQVSSVSAPASVAVGAPFDVSTSILNAGTSSASASVVVLYLSPDATITESDDCLGTRVTGAVAGGASDVAVTTVSPNLGDGVYYIGAIADSTWAVDETDETDNVGVSVTTIAIGTPVAPDAFENDDLFADATPLIVGGSTQSHNHHHQGDRDWLSLSLSAGQDVFVSGTSSGSELTAVVYDTDGQTFLAYGDAVVDMPFTAPATGTYYVAITDGAEPDYTICAVSGVAGADVNLSGSIPSGPDSALAGSTAWIWVSIDNMGLDNSLGFHVDIYLSSDAIITTADTRLARYSCVGIQSWGGANPDLEIDIPAGTAPGPHRLGMIIDADGDVTETNEADNTYVGPQDLLIGCDIQAVSVTCPATANGGDSITVSCSSTVAPAGTAFVRGDVYLSGDTTLDAVDRLVAVTDWTGVVGAYPTIPRGLTSGTYYFIVEYNADRTEIETSYVNNVAVSTGIDITTTAQPDLEGTAVSYSPVPLTVGGTVTITDTVTNSGSAAAGASTVSYLLYNEHDMYDADVFTYLGTRSVGALAASAESPSSTPFTVPDVPGGTYYLDVTADSAAAVQEGWENNNTTTALVSISGADATEPGNNTLSGYQRLYASNWDHEPPPIMTVHEAGDVDWLMIYGYEANCTIHLETVNLSGGMDTQMDLWIVNAATLQATMVAWDDDSGTEAGASSIVHTSGDAEDAFYFLRVYHKDPNGTGFYWVRGERQ